MHIFFTRAAIANYQWPQKNKPFMKNSSPEPKRTMKFETTANNRIALPPHNFFDIHTRMFIFLFQYHVVGRAHDNYSACEYWHLLWFEFAVLFYLRNNSPDIKRSYKGFFIRGMTIMHFHLE